MVATNIAGETTAKFRLSLLKQAPSFVRKLDRAAEVGQGEPLQLKCVIEGSPLPKATWFKDGQELEQNDRYKLIFQKTISNVFNQMLTFCFRIKLTNTPDGVVKLEINKAKPSDCGAYKLVISNPNGENAALCAVAVIRMYNIYSL